MPFSSTSPPVRAISLAAALWLAGCSAERDLPAPTSTAPAPAYEAVTLGGEAASLASLRGQAVLLNVWATWCAPCLEEIPYLIRLHEAHAPRGLNVVGVSIDIAGNRQKVSDLAAALKIPYGVWLDPDEEVRSLIPELNVPASLLIDRNGKVLWTHIGVVQPTTPGFQDALEKSLRAS